MALKHQGPVAHVLGLPRIGAQRELPQAWQAFCEGRSDAASLHACAASLRARHWQWQAEAGLDFVCVGDFAWLDQVFNTLALLGALPTRFGLTPATLDLHACRRLAEGDTSQPAMQLRPWFDTNSFYLQPEWTDDLRFDAGVDWLFDEVQEALDQGYRPKVVLLGPLSLLALGHTGGDLRDPLALLPQAVAANGRVLARLRAQGVELVQIDEPLLATACPTTWSDHLAPTYAALAALAPEILLTTYFGAVDSHLPRLASLPVAGIHIDGVTDVEQLAHFAAYWPQHKVLSVGIIDGRNIWRCDLDAALATLQPLSTRLGNKLWLASSCSLLHVPMDLSSESRLDPELKSWLAFARQKLAEVNYLRQLLPTGGSGAAAMTAKAALLACRAALAARRSSPRTRNALVQRRLAQLSADETRRSAAAVTRAALQLTCWNAASHQAIDSAAESHVASLQGAAVARLQAAHRRGEIGFVDYLEQLRSSIAEQLGRQEAAGHAYLVQSAALGQDAVTFFAQQCWGFAITGNGWVQQHGSHCSKPPLLYGDVYRPEPISVASMQFAQSLTQKPVKVLMCGPLQLLQGVFVRDDQARATTVLQSALVLRDEVADLERVGIGMIRFDEPQLLQAVPHASAPRSDYLAWAHQALQLCTSGVTDMTQIHLHLRLPEDQAIRASMSTLDVDRLTVAS